MFLEERHREIADTIQKSGKITIPEITQRYGISDESARRDLRLLEQKGLCKRVHGGAIVLRQVGGMPQLDRDFAEMPVFDNYREIARMAAREIRENDTIYLTSGSFGYIMLPFLPTAFRYTLVTNSVDIGRELRCLDCADVYVIGGKMRRSGTIVDSFAKSFVEQLHFDRCFVTGAGLTAEFGLSNGTDETASFQRTVICNSRRKYLLMPGTKVGSNAFIRVCDVTCFDTVFTDWDCIPEQIAAIEEKGVMVVAVEKQK